MSNQPWDEPILGKMFPESSVSTGVPNLGMSFIMVCVVVSTAILLLGSFGLFGALIAGTSLRVGITLLSLIFIDYPLAVAHTKLSDFSMVMMWAIIAYVYWPDIVKAFAA